MAISNRAAVLTKIHKGLKKHYEPVKPPADRTVLDHLLFANCLQNSLFDKAEEAFRRLQTSFFDWNEVRVTTVTELSESLTGLADAPSTASLIKRTLQSIFEAHYSYDLEMLRKGNLGKAVKQLERYGGVTPFAIAYVTQNALGGHAIALDDGSLKVLEVLGAASSDEVRERNVPGIERAIPKSKGVEFFSLLHQLGAEYHGSPFSPKIRNMFLAIDPEAKSRFPKRTGRKDGEDKGEVDSAAGVEEPEPVKASPKGEKKGAAKPEVKVEAKVETKKGGEARKAAAGKSKGEPASSSKKASVAKKKPATKRLAKKKPR